MMKVYVVTKDVWMETNSGNVLEYTNTEVLGIYKSMKAAKKAVEGIDPKIRLWEETKKRVRYSVKVHNQAINRYFEYYYDIRKTKVES